MARLRSSFSADARPADKHRYWARLAVPTAALFLAAGTQSGAFAEDAATTDTATATAATNPTSTTSSPTTPDAAQLQAALLTASDLGPSFSGPSGGSNTASGGPTTVKGCEGLAPLLTGTPSGPPPPGADQQDTSLQGGQNGPFVNEALITEPSSNLTSDYAKYSAALKSCTAMSVSADGTTFDFKVSPINFSSGDAPATAARIDATSDGVEVNGYLAVSNLGGVEVEYFYLQVGSGSSQLASLYFTKAVEKATTTLGAAAGGNSGGGAPAAPSSYLSAKPND